MWRRWRVKWRRAICTHGKIPISSSLATQSDMAESAVWHGAVSRGRTALLGPSCQRREGQTYTVQRPMQYPKSRVVCGGFGVVVLAIPIRTHCQAFPCMS